MSGASDDFDRQDDFRHLWNLYAVDDKLSTLLRLGFEDERHKIAPTKPNFVRIKALEAAVGGLQHYCDLLHIGLNVGALAPVEELSIRLRPYLGRRGATVQLPFLSDSSEAANLLRVDVEIDLSPLDSLLSLLAAPAPRSTPSAAWFARLLSLDAKARSEDLGAVLTYVNATTSRTTFDALPTFDISEKVLLEAIATPAEKRTPSERAVAGVEAFIYFNVDLVNLMYGLASPIAVRESVFGLYRHLFAMPTLNAFVDNVMAHCPALDSVELSAVRHLRWLSATEGLPAIKEVEQQAGVQTDGDERESPEAGEAKLRLTTLDVKALQVALSVAGFDAGSVDGAFGPRTRMMIVAWQNKMGFPATGFVTAPQKTALLAQTDKTARFSAGASARRLFQGDEN